VRQSGYDPDPDVPHLRGMSHPDRRGTALLEILLALVLLSGLALLSAPLAVRNSALDLEGRFLLDGTEGALRRAAHFQARGAAGCIAGGGQDSTRLALIAWSAEVVAGRLRLEMGIHDRSGRFPPETLTTVMPCWP